VESEVQALFERIMREHGRLDVLVNSIAGEDPMMGQWGNFWQTKLENSDAILRQALVSHIITAKHAAPLMIRKRRGLIVEVTENDVLGGGGNPLTQTVKFALKGLALNMAAELKTHGVAAVAITPGFLRSESMLERFSVTEDNWRDGGAKDKNFLESESPLFVGRAVAALAGDPKVLARTGHLFSSWDLARDYGFTDADGRRPDWGSFEPDFSKHPPGLIDLIDTGFHLQLDWLNALARRTERYLTNWVEPVAAVRRRQAAAAGSRLPAPSAIKKTAASRGRARRRKRG
jgi:NAD(P)-dependent dehydrogenase (short-subunit alcohol dehydrogenase family)